MNKRQFESKLKKAESSLNGACANLANLFQPYFDIEIHVLYQSGDGFVILYETGNVQQAPVNEAVNEVFNNIKRNKDYYK